jgi:hypothetical protein
METMQFHGPGDLLKETSRRFAGDYPLPGELNVLRDALLHGRFSDHTGSVMMNRHGEFEVVPSDANWRLRGSANQSSPRGQNIEFGYQIGGSPRGEVRVSASPEESVDQALKGFSW